MKPPLLISLALILLLVTAGCLVYETDTARENYSTPCGYDACCQKDTNARAFSCDYQGCQSTVSNWTPPICENEKQPDLKIWKRVDEHRETSEENYTIMMWNETAIANWTLPPGMADPSMVGMG